MSFYTYCKKHGKEYLLEQWDAEKNAPLTPKDLGSTNTTKVWWRCEKGHVWQTQLSSRARGHSGCPLCMKERIAARIEKRQTEKTEKTEKKKPMK